MTMVRKGEEEPTLVNVPIPVRDDLVVTLANVPLDLTTEEAKKISSVILAYTSPASKRSEPIR